MSGPRGKAFMARAHSHWKWKLMPNPYRIDNDFNAGVEMTRIPS